MKIFIVVIFYINRKKVYSGLSWGIDVKGNELLNESKVLRVFIENVLSEWLLRGFFSDILLSF